MPVYRYAPIISVNANEQVLLTIEFPDNGTAASHEIDMPGPSDMEGYNEIEDVLGKGSDLIDDRVVIWTKAFNLDSGLDKVRVNYLINGVLIAAHVNKKSEDTTPQIKVTISFVKA